MHLREGNLFVVTGPGVLHRNGLVFSSKSLCVRIARSNIGFPGRLSNCVWLLVQDVLEERVGNLVGVNENRVHETEYKVGASVNTMILFALRE